MNLTELRKKPHLSISAINTYIDCGLLYWFSRVEKLIPEFKTDVLVFGTVIHRILEIFYQGILEGYKVSLADLCEGFEKHWHDSVNEHVRFTKDNDFNSLLELGINALNIWYQSKPGENYRLLAVEEPFSFHIPGVPLPIIGAMDLIEEDPSGTIIITDHKTPAKAMSEKDVHQNQQLTIYQMAAKNNGYGDREIILKFDCLVKTRQPKFEPYYTTRTDEDEMRLIRKIQLVWEGISKGIFIPNDLSWKCINCAFASACTQWFYGQDHKRLPSANPQGTSPTLYLSQ